MNGHGKAPRKRQKELLTVLKGPYWILQFSPRTGFPKGPTGGSGSTGGHSREHYTKRTKENSSDHLSHLPAPKIQIQFPAVKLCTVPTGPSQHFLSDSEKQSFSHPTVLTHHKPLSHLSSVSVEQTNHLHHLRPGNTRDPFLLRVGRSQN